MHHSRAELTGGIEKSAHTGDEFGAVGGQGGQDGLGAQHAVLAFDADNGRSFGVPWCRSHPCTLVYFLTLMTKYFLDPLRNIKIRPLCIDRLEGDTMEIRDHVSSGKPALILARAGTVIGFAELEKRANRLAHFWYAAGLREGDTVAAILENNEHVHAVMWAARGSGLCYALINPRLTAAEAAYIVDNSSAKAVMGSRATRSICEGLAEHSPGGVPDLLLIADDDLDGWYRYPECVADQPETPIPDESEGDLLQYSSGTTGRPKGIRRELPHLPPSEAPNILMPLMNAVGITSESVYLSPAPLYHTAPSFWSMVVQSLGGTTVVMEKFDPEHALECIQRYGITHGQFVPAMFVRMLKLPEAVRMSYDVSSLQRVVHAAAPCPVEIKKQMIAWWGPLIAEYYAASEAVGAS